MTQNNLLSYTVNLMAFFPMFLFDTPQKAFVLDKII